MSKPSTTEDGKTVGYGLGLMLGTVRGIPVVEHNGGIGKIVALDFYTDGMPPARRESRVSSQ